RRRTGSPTSLAGSLCGEVVILAPRSGRVKARENRSPGCPLLMYPCAMPPRRWSLLLPAAVAGAFAFADAFAALAAAAPLVYVSAEDGGEVVAVDVDKGEVVARIAVGKRPRGLKLSRDGKLLYVALSGSARGGPGVDESKLPPPDRDADGVGVVDLGSHK